MRPNRRTQHPYGETCYRCAEVIERGQRFSRDHVPPLQFFPSRLREEFCPQLDTVHVHARCDEATKLDEDYFRASVAPMATHNPIGAALCEDLKRAYQYPSAAPGSASRPAAASTRRARPGTRSRRASRRRSSRDRCKAAGAARHARIAAEAGPPHVVADHRDCWRRRLLSAWGVTANNRQARYYLITAVGRRALGSELESWKRFAAALDAVLRTT
jgi:hypothetical protein